MKLTRCEEISTDTKPVCTQMYVYIYNIIATDLHIAY